MIEPQGDVYCEVLGGELDGLFFRTASVYTQLHIRLNTAVTFDAGVIFQYTASLSPFEGSTLIKLSTISDSGTHVYRPTTSEATAS